MSTKRGGKKETKQEPPTQYRVIDPVSLADLENIYTRKGKYPTKPPPLGQATWENVKRKKEEKLRKAMKERPLSTPLESTSTDAMDTEETQEFSREIAAKAAEKELRKQSSLGLNLCCPVLAHPIMKKYPCIVRDHLPDQGQSQLHPWSQTKKRNHRELGQKSLPIMYQPFKIIPLT